MNKLTKAAIAGGVGIALLLGGAGTLATWNSSNTISGGTIVAGNLLVGTPATGSWSVSHTTGILTTITPLSLTNGTFTVTNGGSAYTASPGDQLTYKTTVPLTVTGTNLSATLALTQQAITATSTATADTQLAADLAKSANVAMVTGTGITSAGSPAVYTISGAAVSPVVTLTATMTFPSTANDAMMGSVSFAGWALALTQIP